MNNAGCCLIALCLAVTSAVAAGRPAPGADHWVTTSPAYPDAWQGRNVASNRFSSLRAEVIAGRLRLILEAAPFATNARVQLHASADEPGHWPARDWSAESMSRRGQSIEAVVRVTDLDVPVVYFVSAIEPGLGAPGRASITNLSPMRVCRPDLAGMEEPSHIFWPFLDGFEESLDGWRLVSSNAPPLRKAPEPKSGLASLLVTLPAGRQSVTVVTTRIRGWHAAVRNATGVCLWLRTRAGTARAKFTLQSDASTPAQQVAVCPREVTLSNQWQKVDLAFAEFPGVNLTRVDLFAIDFIADGPCEFLIDDVYLLGPWRIDLE